LLDCGFFGQFEVEAAYAFFIVSETEIAVVGALVGYVEAELVS
jgi:hypothetical protein